MLLVCPALLYIVWINEVETVETKWFVGLLLFAGMIGLEYERERLLRRPWTIQVSEDHITGISRRGDRRIDMAWSEIGRISRPGLWAIGWHGDIGIILESQDGRKQFYIGKLISGYKELAQIIREKLPHLSHEYL